MTTTVGRKIATGGGALRIVGQVRETSNKGG